VADSNKRPAQYNDITSTVGEYNTNDISTPSILEHSHNKLTLYNVMKCIHAIHIQHAMHVL